MLSLFQKLCLKGFSPIPIQTNDKRPAIKGWQEFAERRPTEADVSHWPRSSNIGLALGGTTQLIALDYDNHLEIGERIAARLPQSPCRKVGQKGWTDFYRYNGERSRKWSKNGETVVELLSTGRQTVIPPSIHPCGEAYRWVTELTLLDDVELPVLPADLSRIVEEELGVNNHSVAQLDSNHVELCTDDDLRAALAVIPADDYDTWVKVGMSLVHEPGGFDIWDAWSRTSDKYREGETARKWQSFQNVNGYSVKSIFFEAGQRGYRQNQMPDVDNLDISWIQAGEEPEPVIKKSMVLPEDVVKSAPGMVGRISEWITSIALYPQPELALGAALTVVGALKGHRVQTETGLRTNNYIMGIAPSGSGKDHAITCLQILLFDAGAKDLFGGKPVSDSGILTMLQEHPCRLVVWDELGLALKEISEKSVPSFKRSIISLMMELFSAAGRRYIGKQYANKDNKTPRVDIDQPCLSIYGMSTPSHFYESLTRAMVEDGFLARWLIFDIQTKFPPLNPLSADRYVVPHHLLSEVSAYYESGGSQGAFPAGTRTVPFTAEGRDFIREAQMEYDRKKEEYFKKGDGMQSFWARAAEHVQKIALTIQEGERITLDDLRWARRLVDHCVDALCVNVEEKVVDNEFARRLRVTKEVIGQYPDGAPKQALLKKLYYKIGKNSDVKEVLSSLIALGEVREEKKAGKGRTSTVYKLSTL